MEIRLSGFFEEEGVTFEVPFSVSVLPWLILEEEVLARLIP